MSDTNEVIPKHEQGTNSTPELSAPTKEAMVEWLGTAEGIAAITKSLLRSKTSIQELEKSLTLSEEDLRAVYKTDPAMVLAPHINSFLLSTGYIRHIARTCSTEDGKYLNRLADYFEKVTSGDRSFHSINDVLSSTLGYKEYFSAVEVQNIVNLYYDEKNKSATYFAQREALIISTSPLYKYRDMFEWWFSEVDKTDYVLEYMNGVRLKYTTDQWIESIKSHMTKVNSDKSND